MYIFVSMKITMRIFMLSFLLLFIGACSDYQKVVRGDDYEEKFIEANRLYDKGSYTKAIALYEQVYQRFPKTDQGQVAYYRMAKAYFEEKDYFMAGYYFNQFSIRYPLSENAEEALFMTAMCSVQNSPSYSLDQQETELALNDLQLFIQRYPNSLYVDSCNNVMDRLRLKLETKRFEAVKLYDKTQDNRAAVASAKSFLEDYPRSVYLKEAALLELENSYQLAVNSILSKKKERIENAMDTYTKYKHLFDEKKSLATRANKLNENLVKEMSVVEERYSFNEIVVAFENSNSSSSQKKVRYLEETITRFNNFAQKYPNSSFLEKARSYYKKADKELNNI